MIILGAVVALVLIVILAAIADQSGTSGVREAVLAGLLAVITLAVLLMVSYLRSRPVPPSRTGLYHRVITLQVIVSLLPAAAGYVAFTAAGAWWLQLAGAVASLPGLALSWPTPQDLERRCDLWSDAGPAIRKKVWGSAAPDEISEWMEWEPDFGAHAPPADK
jgi:hypothetical protein